MTTEQSQKAEAELLGDSLAQDRIESEIVWLLMAQGGNVEHRSDVAPQAILGVHLKTNTPNGMPPTTSPLVWDIVRPGRRRMNCRVAPVGSAPAKLSPGNVREGGEGWQA